MVMEGVAVRHRWTLAELQEAQRLHQRQSRYGRWMPVTLLTLAGVLVCMEAFLIVRRGTLEGSWGTFGLVAYLVLMVTLLPFMRRWAVRRNHARSVDRDAEIRWQITATSLRNETANSTSETKWAAFNKAVQTPGGLLLYPQPRLFYWLPRHGFETEEGFETVIAWAREHIKDFRAVRW